MASEFPALRGRMGEMDFCVLVMRLGEVVKHVGYAEDVQHWDDGIPAEHKKQRKLNRQRIINEMVPYLTVNPDHFYSAITVELERPGDPTNGMVFQPIAGQETLGTVKFDGTELLMALDGQHRLKSIDLALKEQPDLSKESIAVLVVPGRGYRRSQQLFSDLNRYAKQPSKTLNLLFEHREFFARVAKGVADKATSFEERVNLETNSLGRKTRHHMTLAVLYECVVTLLEGSYAEGEKDPAKQSEAIDTVVHVYDDVVFASLPDFKRILSGELMPYDLRCKYIYAHSVGQQGIAKAIRACRDHFGAEWEDVVRTAFPKIDWKITNVEWEGSAVQGGAIQTRRQNVEHTATLIKLKLGAPVESVELESLRAAIQATDPKRKLPEPLVHLKAA
jgi:DNA sulfur modification protein DndB